MSDMAIGTTEVSLRTADGVQLSACWYQRSDRAALPDDLTGVAVVVVHGFAARKDQPAVVAVAGRLVEQGFPVLLYDGRGHGASGGACTLGMHERLDVAAAVHEASVRAEHVVAVGSSMGGIAVLGHLAAIGDSAGSQAVACGGVVVSTPARWRVPRNARGAMSAALTQTRTGRALAARRLGVTIAPPVERIAPPDQQISMIECPIAIVHGAVDRFIPAADAQRLHAAARPPCSINVVAEMAHGYCAAALDAIADGVRWVIGQQLAPQPDVEPGEV